MFSRVTVFEFGRVALRKEAAGNLQAGRAEMVWQELEADIASGWLQFQIGMKEGQEQEASKQNGQWKSLRRGWCWGSKDFRQELLELIGEKKGAQHYGEELQESDEQKARRLIREILDKAGWTEEELSQQPKGDWNKANTTATLPVK